MEKEKPQAEKEPGIQLEVPAYRFNSISDIIHDQYFIEFLDTNIAELVKNRLNRPMPKPGYRYKRDWYDRMSSLGNINSELFIKNIEPIWLRKSSLNSEMRNIIQFVCDKSLQQTLLAYSKINNQVEQTQTVKL